MIFPNFNVLLIEMGYLKVIIHIKRLIFKNFVANQAHNKCLHKRKNCNIIGWKKFSQILLNLAKQFM